MILVLGTVRLAPEKLDEARPAMKRMVTASRAEDGCIAYGYGQDVLDPTIIHVVEKWRDMAALEAHFASSHMKEWRGVMSGLGLTGRDLKVFESDEGRPI